MDTADGGWPMTCPSGRSVHRGRCGGPAPVPVCPAPALTSPCGRGARTGQEPALRVMDGRIIGTVPCRQDSAPHLPDRPAWSAGVPGLRRPAGRMHPHRRGGDADASAAWLQPERCRSVRGPAGLLQPPRRPLQVEADDLMAEPAGHGLHQRRIGQALRPGGGREAGRCGGEMLCRQERQGYLGMSPTCRSSAV